MCRATQAAKARQTQLSYDISRYILFETRTGDEKDDNNSLQTVIVIFLVTRSCLK